MSESLKKPASAKQATVMFLKDGKKLRCQLRYFLWREGQEAFSIGTFEDSPGNSLLDGQKRPLMASYLHLDPMTKELEGYSFVQRGTKSDPDLSYVRIGENHEIWDLYDVNAKDVRHLVQLTNLNGLFAAVRSILNESFRKVSSPAAKRLSTKEKRQCLPNSNKCL